MSTPLPMASNGSAATNGAATGTSRAGIKDDVILDVKGLRKFFPIRRGFLRKTVGHVRAVDDVDFFIKRGETLALVGDSGCGKTTTSRCVLRAIDATDGQILF